MKLNMGLLAGRGMQYIFAFDFRQSSTLFKTAVSVALSYYVENQTYILLCI